jgi:hypothetical protein
MILPDNLTPLPIALRDDGAADAGEDFVHPGEVRRLLLAEVSRGEPPKAGKNAALVRGGAPEPVAALRSPRVESEGESEGESAFEGLHPAFEVSPAARRAAPPRLATDGEEGFGQAGARDRWWVVGMGLAAAGVLLSGVAVDFIFREGMRRGHIEVPPPRQVVAPVSGLADQAEPEAHESLAASLRADDRP